MPTKDGSGRRAGIAEHLEMEFNFRPLAKSCAKSGRTFRPGEQCWSVLVDRDGQLVRQDFSLDAWSGPPEGAVGHWRSQVPEAVENNRPRLDADSLFESFVQLCDSPNIVQQQYRYVLALLLLRKRRLILEEVIEVNDRPAMRLVGSGGEGPFDVVEEDLNEEQVERLQAQLLGQGRLHAA
jgi:hypothetical protein